MKMKGFRAIRWVVLGVWLFVAAWASVSVSTGVVLPGWEKLNSGPLVDKAKKIVRDYARQLDGVYCISPEVHYRSGGNLVARSLYVDGWFESNGMIIPLLEDPDQYVFLFIPNLGIGKNLVVVFDLSDGLLLVAC